MDGGSVINILYVSTLQRMDVPLEALHPSTTEFHGIVPRNKMVPIGRITLEAAFGTPFHFRCEVITFEVVPFVGGYDAVLGRTVFAKVHGHPKLRLHADEDASAPRCHHNPWQPLAGHISIKSQPGGGRSTHKQKQEMHPQSESTRDMTGAGGLQQDQNI